MAYTLFFAFAFSFVASGFLYAALFMALADTLSFEARL